MQYSIKTRQICFFLIAFLPITKMFMLPSVVAGIAGEDMWISTILNLFLDWTTIFFLLTFLKNEKGDFFDVIEKYFGKTTKTIFLVLYLIYFLLKAYLPINEQKDYVEQTLYITMPNILTFLPFFALAVYLCVQPIRVYGRCADIMWIVTLVGTFLLISLSITNINLEALLPVGAQKIDKVIGASYKSLAWFGEGAYLLFFVGKFQYKKGDGKKIYLSYALASIIVVIFSILFYCTFTSVAFRQTFALTEVSKYNTVINNLGRFDYVGIMLILFSTAFSLVLPMYFSCKILNKLFPIKRKWIYALLVTLLYVLLLTVFNEYAYSFESFILNVASGIFLIFSNIVPIAVCIIKGVIDRKNNKSYQHITLKNTHRKGVN